jgi:hypothetical protein
MRQHGIEGPIVLTADGFPGHISLDIQKFCNANDVIFVVLLPNATFLIQPLDVGVFKSVKAEMKVQTRLYKRVEKKIELSEVDFIRILSHTLKQSITADLVKKSFATTGLYPLNPTYPHPERLLSQTATVDNQATFLPHDPLSQEITPEVLVENASNPPHQDFLSHFKAFNENYMKNINEDDHAAKMCIQVIQHQLNSLESLQGNGISPAAASPTPNASNDSSTSTQNTLQDIFTVPAIQPPTRKRTIKLHRHGIMSSNEAITAAEEKKQEDEAKKEGVAERKRARLERQATNLKIKQENAEKKLKKKELPKAVKVAKTQKKSMKIN